MESQELAMIREKKRKSTKKKKNNNNCCNKKKEYGLISYNELPEYMKENEYIWGYYRSEWPLSHAFLSLFSWHNETINIWTHLIGFYAFLGFTLVHLGHVPQVANLLGHFPWSISSNISENISCNQSNFTALKVISAKGYLKIILQEVFVTLHEKKKDASSSVVLLVENCFSVSSTARVHDTGSCTHICKSLQRMMYSSKLEKDQITSCFLKLDQPTTATAAARWPFLIFLSGSMFCLLTSSSCHLFCCHSHRLNLFLARLDYSGIAIMIVTSFFPPIYYIFQCTPAYQITYLTAISLFGLLTVVTLLSPELSRGKFRSYRAMLFVAMGLFGVVPAVHAVVVNWTEPRRNVILAYEGAMAGSYLIGTGFYISRVPEKWRPGWFDLAGSSHQIFHVFVMLGALAHYGAGLIFLAYRDVIGCAAS